MRRHRFSSPVQFACLLIAGCSILICAAANAADAPALASGPAGASTDTALAGAAIQTQTPAAASVPAETSAPAENCYIQAPAATAPVTPRNWLNLSYLMWFMKDQPVPVPLATNGSSTVLGNTGFDPGVFSGLRLDLGTWLDAGQTTGVELTVMGFVNGNARNTVMTQTSLLERPFFDLATGIPNNLPLAVPGSSAGLITAATNTFLVGGELNALSRVLQTENSSADLIVGFRNIDLVERLGVSSASDIYAGGGSFLGVPFAAPGTLLVSDQFLASNAFFGGQIGGRFQTGNGPLVLSGFGKVGLGGMVEHTSVVGITSATIPAGPYPVAVQHLSGFLANRDNGGRQSHTNFAAVPEVGLNLGYKLTPRVLVSAGYSFLYLSNVVRPGDQVNSQIDSRAVPSSPNYAAAPPGEKPTQLFNTTDFWVHGVNFSATLRF